MWICMGDTVVGNVFFGENLSKGDIVFLKGNIMSYILFFF
jgi:hypothetical protein